MNRSHALLFCILLSVSSFVHARQQSVSTILNINGQIVGTVATPAHSQRAKPALMESQMVRTPAGRECQIATGVYFLIPQSHMESETSGNEPGFTDITSTVFPQQQWDAGAIRTGDLNGDGRQDVVFSRYTVLCDSIGAENRPRVWIQTPAGAFVDETESRMPPIIAPADDMILFDADGDGDKDIFLRGYQCGTLSLLAAILINDGTGYFSDETATRLPSSASGAGASFVLRAAAGLLDDDALPDLVLTVMRGDTAGALLSHPEIWLNNGFGSFTRDTLGRIAGLKNYGYFTPYIVRVNPDTMPDILFANIGMVNINPDSGAIDTTTGRTACFRNIGNAFFHDETTSRIPDATDLSARLLAPIDVNADGVLDFLEIHFPSLGDPHQISLFTNSGSGIFTDAPGAIPDSIVGWFNTASVARFDGDEFPDAFLGRVAPGGDGTDVFLRNNGNGTLKDASSLLPPLIDFTLSSDTLDLQRKGAPDIVVGNLSSSLTGKGQNRFYFNRLLGSPWATKKSGVEDRLNDVLLLDTARAIAVGDRGLIIETRDGGASWARRSSGTSSNLNTIRTDGSGAFWAAGDSVLLSSTNDGTDWGSESITGVVTAMGVVRGWIGYDLFLGRSDGLLMKRSVSIPGPWTEYGFEGGRINAIGFGPGGLNTYAVYCASMMTYYRSMNEGVVWDSSAIHGIGFWDEIRTGDLDHLPQYLAGAGGDFAVFPLVVQTSDTTWRRVDPQPSSIGSFNAIRAFPASADVFACGSEGMIYMSTDAGSSWTRQFSGTMLELRGMSFLDEQHGVIVGDSGIVLWLQATPPVGIEDEGEDPLPAGFVLEQNYPNPFNPSTTIFFSIERQERVRLAVYDILGREVNILVDDLLPAGRYGTEWNAAGHASGVYYYRLTSGAVSVTKKLVLVR